MPFVHGKDTFVSLDGVDLSAFTNSTEFNDGADSHDVTTYGQTRHVFTGGLGTGTVTISGIYNNDVAGPRATIKPLIGTVVPFIFQPEGAGSGLPEDAVDVLVTAYNETNAVADMVMWTSELQMSGDLTTGAQV